HGAAGGLTLDGFLGLALGADEQDQAALGGELHQVAVGAQQAADGLPQVDDVDEVALAVDERPHLGVPTAGPVPEVNTRLDQILPLDNRHSLPSCPEGGQPVRGWLDIRPAPCRRELTGWIYAIPNPYYCRFSPNEGEEMNRIIDGKSGQ